MRRRGRRARASRGFAGLGRKQAAQLKDFLIFFGLQFISYFLIVANTRAYVHGLYVATAISDVIFTALQFTVIKKVGQSKGPAALIGYTLGGTLGSLFSIAVTMYFYGR